ncbi:Uncharacterised protein [Streptococcus criceti]|uniref:Uncharacterized protein n=1 Tax=Streptococcus criceti HS-6 TaxID=873449 RepID=G5JTB5_STRCG|nr:hypothetical protein STRCR_2305 [Streptococcus criceti HS-6]SUN43552.1 Uncharacterised protein [Streptococcus criceti]
MPLHGRMMVAHKIFSAKMVYQVYFTGNFMSFFIALIW